MVPAGVDDQNVALADRVAAGLFEIVPGDRLPFLLGQRHDDPCAEEMRQRHLVDEGRALHHVRGGVDVGGGVHGGGDALAQHPRLGHVVDALDLGVLEVGPVRVLKPEAVAEVVELQPHVIVRVRLELDSANFHHRAHLLCSPQTGACAFELSGWFLPPVPHIDADAPHRGQRKSRIVGALYRIAVQKICRYSAGTLGT